MEFKKDHWKLFIICLLGALRVFVFSAGFPFFNNVDEIAHFDLVVKYSHAEVPHSLETLSKESSRYYIRNGTYGYSMKTGVDYAPIKYEKANVSERLFLDEGEDKYSKVINHESSQPPLYYALAGAWKNLGSFFGMRDANLLYWIRFLNIVFIVLLVLISYHVSTSLFPSDRFLIFGIPLIVAMLPQDTFYSVQNDVLSPLCFALCFVFLLKFIRADLNQKRYAFFTGIALALTALVKISNLPLLIVVLTVVVFKMYKLYLYKKLKQSTQSVSVFFASAFIPIISWLMWNVYVLGDITGSEEKIKILGWTHKPFLEWFKHPLFSDLAGVFFMLKELMITFWRGELIWAGQRVAVDFMDFFYWTSSLVFVFITLFFVQRKVNVFQRKVNRFLFICFVSMVGYMVLISISFDFGACPYPSKALPYLTSGRLISAVTLPFVILYAQGLNWLVSWVKQERLRFLFLIGIVTVITISEMSVSQKVFLSNFNWFRY